MDRKSIIGMILIFVVVSIWISIQKPPQKGISPASADSGRVDTALVKEESIPEKVTDTIPPLPENNTIMEAVSSDTVFSGITGAPEPATIQIENEYISATISSAGGVSFTSWELKNYKSYLGGNVNLANNNGISLEFTNRDGKPIDLNAYTFFINSATTPPGKIILNENNSETEIEFYLPVENGRIVKKVKFFYDKYSVDLTVEFQHLQNYIINRRFFIGWKNGLPFTEENHTEDFNYSRAYANMAGELENIDVSKEKVEEKSFNGKVDWAAVKTKYFSAAVVPHAPDNVNGVILRGEGKKEGEVVRKIFSMSLDVNYIPSENYTQSFTVFIGPLDYGVLKAYDVDLQSLVMNNGWYESLFRPIALLVLAMLKVMHSVIPNYGFVIIIFSILIKIILHPLTKKSHKSMSEMQYFQPKITELREKYKDDPQRMNKEMMKFYKEHGINPLGGCLPTLLQMPLLFALFIVFRSTIQLRGQPFILWITDLSSPDVLHIGMNLPFIGDTIHILPILMAVSMIWQSKMTITDPKQKMMAYLMPAFLLFVFYSFPSGLNLYYSLFNFLTMFQTRLIKKKLHPGDDKTSSEKQPEKKSPPVKKQKKSNRRK
ncbi:MAG: membrane protein insertase YidC [Calditrichia bacterium]